MSRFLVVIAAVFLPGIPVILRVCQEVFHEQCAAARRSGISHANNQSIPVAQNVEHQTAADLVGIGIRSANVLETCPFLPLGGVPPRIEITSNRP